MYEYKARLKSVVDGDTLDLYVDVGFRVTLTLRVRLLGVDAPEMHGVLRTSPEYARGVKARDFVIRWFSAQNREVLIARTQKDTQDKYGRWLATIVDDLGLDLNSAVAEFCQAL